MQGELRGAQSSVSSTLGTVGKVAAAAVAAAGAAVVAMGGAVAKVGIQYNAYQESSQVAWTTLLGSATKAKQMVQDISTFAAKTQFDTEGVDQMAKFLQNAGYSGKALFDQLTRVADVSGAFNITADNARELVRQMSQVDQAQVAYTQDLNQLQDQGVPIYKAIASELGVNVAAVRKMASEGKITSDIYDKAFNNVANTVKGSADKQSATWNGMMSTLKDDFSIIMGILERPIFNALHNGLTQTLNVLNGFVSLGRGDMKGFMDTMSQTFGSGTAKTIQNFISGVKEGYANGFGQMITKAGTFGAAIGNAFYVVQDAIGKAKGVIVGFFDLFKGDIDNGVGWLRAVGLSPEVIGEIVADVAKVKATFIVFFEDFKIYIKAYADYWKNLFSGKNSLANSFISIFDTIKKIAMPILQDIVKFIGDEFSQIKKWWDTYGGQITEAVKNFWAVIAAIFKALAPVILFILESLWGNIKGIISGAISIIQGIILVFTSIFTGNWKLLWTGIKDILGGALEVVWNIIQLMFIGKLLKGIGGFFGLVKELFSGGWTSIVNGIKLFVDDTGAWFDKFLVAAKTNFDKIIDAAKNIPSGIVAGLKSGISTIKDGIVGLANSLVDEFKKALGIHSPSKVFESLGGHVISGLVNGLTGGNLMDLGKAVFSDFGGGIMNTVGKIKGFLQGAFSGGASGNVAGWIQSALSIVGAPSSWAGALGTIIQNESGGNPNSINLWDSNAKAGHPSQGLMQLIPSTFASYALQGLGGITNPLANIVAGIRYIQSRYGSVFNVPGIQSMASGGAYRGYASGGYASGWSMVGEEGPEMMYLPNGTNIRSNADTKKLFGNGLTDAISGAVANAVLQVMQSNKQSNPSGDIVLNLDGRTFARIIKPWTDLEAKRVGTNVRLQSV